MRNKLALSSILTTALLVLTACGGDTKTSSENNENTSHPAFLWEKVAVSNNYSPSGDTTDLTPTFTWKAVSGANEYNFGHENTAGGFWEEYNVPAAEAGCATGTVCSYKPADKIFNLGDQSVWWVRGKVAGKWQIWSSPYVFKIIDSSGNENKSKPTTISPKNGNIITQYRPRLTFTWKPVSNAKSWEIGIQNRDGTNWKSFTFTKNNNLYAPKIHLSNGDYTWWIRAKKLDGSWSNWSNDSHFSLNRNNNESVLKALHPIGEISTLKPTFRWTKIKEASRYEIGVEHSNGGDWKTYKVSPQCSATSCTYTPSDLGLSPIANKNSMKWYIRAYVKRNWTDWSDEATFNVKVTSSEHPCGTGTKGKATTVEMIECLVKKGGDVFIGAGTYEFRKELTINKPVNIIGEGKDKTKLRFTITREEASVRILSSNVTVSNLDIDVYLKHSLNDGIHKGGRGEYGTGITIGRYLTTEQQTEKKNINISNISISRTGGGKSYINYTAAALTIIGNVSEATINKVEMKDYHSSAIILHWGGHSTVAPSPQALADPAYDLYTSYHPHNINIRNITVEKSARLIVVSSSYNININNVSGLTSEIMFALPGDEVDIYARDSDKNKLMSNIKVQNITADMYWKAADYAIRMSSVGTSKITKENDSYIKRKVPYKDFILENINIKSVKDKNINKFRYGINLNNFYGQGNIFRNITLNTLASHDVVLNNKIYPSYGVYLRDSKGIAFDNISTNARVGFGLIASQDISITNTSISHRSNNSSKKSYGIYLADTDNKTYSINNININDSSISDYQYGIWYQNGACNIQNRAIVVTNLIQNNISDNSDSHICE